MSSTLPSSSEIKYLTDNEDGSAAASLQLEPRTTSDAMRRQRRASAKDFFNTPASQRLKSSPSNRVVPTNGTPAKGRWTQTQINRYVKRFPHMKAEEIRSLETLFYDWDRDSSGEISMEEMMTMMERVVRDLFDKTDKDNSGTLEAAEVRQLALELGQNLTEEELDEAMDQMDNGVGANGVDGQVRDTRAIPRHHAIPRAALCSFVRLGYFSRRVRFSVCVTGVPRDLPQVGFDEFANWWLGKGGKGASSDAQAEELADLFSEVDSDGSGAIDVDEFVGMIAGKMEMISLRSTASAGENSEEPPVREGMAMVRLALQSVKDDVRAIYGMDERPKSTLRAAQDLENTTREKRCFFTTEPLGRPFWVNFRRGWDAVQVLVLTYIAIAVPYRTGFDLEVATGSFTFWFEVLCDVYFVFDIFLNFRTAYRDDDGVLITDTKVIAHRYLRSWFIIDICACFPVTYIELLIGYERKRLSFAPFDTKSDHLTKTGSGQS
jgi:Ca2+-binding EF-hand superfamily protein